MHLRNLRRHFYIAPLVVAVLLAMLTAYAGIPHDGGRSPAGAPVAAMSIPF